VPTMKTKPVTCGNADGGFLYVWGTAPESNKNPT